MVTRETLLFTNLLSPTFSVHTADAQYRCCGWFGHGEGRKWCSLALQQISKWLNCTYSRCFLNVMLLCCFIRIIWDMNKAKLNGYNFIAVKFLISAPLLSTPGERCFYSFLYPECPAHAYNKTILRSVTYLKGFLNFRSWAKRFTYVILFNHGKSLWAT